MPVVGQRHHVAADRKPSHHRHPCDLGIIQPCSRSFTQEFSARIAVTSASAGRNNPRHIVDELMDACRRNGIAIKDTAAFSKTLAEVCHCFETPLSWTLPLHDTLTATSACLTEARDLLPRLREIVERCRGELSILDGFAYGVLAHRAAPGDAEAGDTLLQSLLDKTLPTVQALDEFARTSLPVEAWIDSALPALHDLERLSDDEHPLGRGRPTNSPRIFYGVLYLCEFWWRDQGTKPYAEYDSDGPRSRPAKFIEIVMRNVLEIYSPDDSVRLSYQIRTELERAVKALPRVGRKKKAEKTIPDCLGTTPQIPQIFIAKSRRPR